MPHPEVSNLLANGPTGPYRGQFPDSRSLPRCRVMKGSHTTGYSQEFASLLQYRLKLVSLLVLVPTILMLISLFLGGGAFSLEDLSLCLAQTGTAIVIAVLSAVLWFWPCLCLPKLRMVEVCLFGVMALFFSYAQFVIFQRNELFDAADKMPQILPLLRIVALGSSARWFFLIVIYGVFIPNSWKRCLLITAVAAIIPLLLTFTAAALNHHLTPALWAALGDLTIVLFVGVTIAVFGSYRLHLLQEQAYEAKQLGQYRLKRKLGSGGMGDVYEAEHLLLRRPCAIKLIRPEHAGDPTNLLRFEREVQTMARLTHWNTVEVFDYGHSDDGRFYYVMEYLPGHNLDVLVARHGPLPPARVIHFLRQICHALREAHNIGLLHRDIKPSNVIACERGGIYDVAKLLDFGLVQQAGFHPDADKLTVQGTIIGSPPFMSPEQAMGKSHLDARSDIYSLGALAYYLLTGQPPFARETPMEMLMAHAYEPLEAPSRLRPEVPSDLEAVILGCLQKKREDRFQDVDSLDRALARCTCSDDWTDAEAKAWWIEKPLPEVAAETEDHMPVKTMVTGRV